jgi:hypothetical protein
MNKPRMDAKKRLSSTAADERRFTQIKTTDSCSCLAVGRPKADPFAAKFWQRTKLFHLRSSAVKGLSSCPFAVVLNQSSVGQGPEIGENVRRFR